MNNTIKISALSLLFFSSFFTHATKNFDNSGNMTTKKASFRVQEVFNHNGQIVAQEEFDCVCGTMTGNGYIKSPKIKIVTNDFQFKGVIECDGECTIISAKPVNRSQCTFKGKGKYTFTVDPNACAQLLNNDNETKEPIRPFVPVAPTFPVVHPNNNIPTPVNDRASDVSTHSSAYVIEIFLTYIDTKLLSLAPQAIDMAVEEVRFRAEKAHLNEKDILNTLLRRINTRIEYDKQRIGTTWTPGLSATGLAITAGGLFSLKYFLKQASDEYNKNHNFEDAKFQVMVGLTGASGAMAMFGGLLALAGLGNPQHKERCDKYMIVKQSLEHALSNPRKNIRFV